MKAPNSGMSDSEFQRLEKAEQEVVAQIAQQKETCDNLRAEFRAIRDDFLESYNAIFRPLQASLSRLSGDEWNNHRDRLSAAVSNCDASIKDTDTSEDIAKMHSALKARIGETLNVSDSTVNQFEEMSASLRSLKALVLGDGSRDVLEELEFKKQRLEQEEEKLKSLQDKYDRYFGNRRPKGATPSE